MGEPLKHGETINGIKSPEYKAWSAMKSRCSNPRDLGWPNYGGRGIRVCDRWLHDFSAFLADMGRRPSPRHSIDRINNNGNYTPSNCRWATTRQQTRNYSRNRLLTLGRRTKTIMEWSEETGIPFDTIASRIDKLGWTVARTLSVPRQLGWDGAANTGKDRKTHCANGHEYTPDNSGRDSAGWRFCRLCNRERSREYMRKQRASARSKRKPRQL